MLELSTSELLEQAAAGNSAAWDEIVSRYSGLVWAVARGFALSMADAADVSQTTWLRLVEHLGKLREPEHLGGWLATTARHECLRTLRKSGREVVAFDADIDIESGEPTPEAVVLDDERDRLVWLSLGEIPQRCQVLLRALSTLTTSELRRGVRSTRHAHRQYRPDPRAVSRPSQEAAASPRGRHQNSGRRRVMSEPTADPMFATLRNVIDHADPVPQAVVDAARAAYTWRTIDAELAELTADSAMASAGRAIGIRAATADL